MIKLFATTALSMTLVASAFAQTATTGSVPDAMQDWTQDTRDAFFSPTGELKSESEVKSAWAMLDTRAQQKVKMACNEMKVAAAGAGLDGDDTSASGTTTVQPDATGTDTDTTSSTTPPASGTTGSGTANASGNASTMGTEGAGTDATSGTTSSASGASGPTDGVLTGVMPEMAAIQELCDTVEEY